MRAFKTPLIGLAMALTGSFIGGCATTNNDSKQANQLAVDMYLVDKKGQTDKIGVIKIKTVEYGVELTPNLSKLTPGLHGFHIHQNPSCGPSNKNGKTVPAGAAGGHYDPTGAGKHGTPWGNGHLGDLPPLFVDNQGKATAPVLAPRIKLADLKGRALMVHAGGDNHSDNPKKLGGGGARMACGVIAK